MKKGGKLHTRHTLATELSLHNGAEFGQSTRDHLGGGGQGRSGGVLLRGADGCGHLVHGKGGLLPSNWGRRVNLKEFQLKV